MSVGDGGVGVGGSVGTEQVGPDQPDCLGDLPISHVRGCRHVHPDRSDAGGVVAVREKW